MSVTVDTDDAVVDGADGPPPSHHHQGNVGGELLHAGVHTVLVRRLLSRFFFFSMLEDGTLLHAVIFRQFCCSRRREAGDLLLCWCREKCQILPALLLIYINMYIMALIDEIWCVFVVVFVIVHGR